MALHILKYRKGGSMPTAPLEVSSGVCARAQAQEWCAQKGVEFVDIKPFIPLSLCAAPAVPAPPYEL